MKTHKDLEVWKSAIDLVVVIYEATKNFPNSEIYGLTNQIRRAAVSVPANIAEGSGRNRTGDLNHFLGIATGFLS